MKSMAAYYAFLAMSNQQLDDDRRHARFAEPSPARPSLLARIRAQLAAGRASRPVAKPV
jgi:hypothetical protein